MDPFYWHDSLATGIDEIDQQHRILVGMLEELRAAYCSKQDYTLLSKIILALSEYTEYHFGTEEKLMRQHNYPYITSHLAEHDEFHSRSVQFLFEFVEDKEELSTHVLHYLSDWLVRHIMGTDKRLGAFLQPRLCSKDQEQSP